MTPVKAVNHIGIAVRSIDAQRAFYEGILGAVFEGVEVVADQKVRVGFFRVGDVRFELLEPTEPSSTVVAFLEKRGEGLHHVALTVEGLEARIAEHHFADADLGDRRRTRRLVDAAAPIAAQPEKTFTQLFDGNDLRGFYRLCDQDQASHQAILPPHGQRTRQALAHESLVLILHDTSELDFTHHPALTGVGPIGDGNGQGFLQHNSLAVLPQPRQVIGLTYQPLKVRPPQTPRQNSYRRKKRPGESERWLEGLDAAGPAAHHCCGVDVADRGGDIYQAMQAARSWRQPLLFRVCQDRLLTVAAASGQPPAPRMAYARTLPREGKDSVDIPGPGGRPPQTAPVSLALVSHTALYLPFSVDPK